MEIETYTSSLNDYPQNEFSLLVADYDQLIVPLLDAEEPCYILYKLDSKNNLGHQWIFISYVPDFAPVC